MTLYKNKYRVESARLKNWDYTSPGFYFVTLCTRGRECFFGDVVNDVMQLSSAGQIVAEEWMKTESVRANVKMDAWVVMPNHVHGIVQITHRIELPPAETSHDVETLRRNVSTNRNVSTEAPSRLQANSLGAILGQIKMQCTKQIRAVGVTDFGWQERFWDEVMWDERGLTRVREYIENNPANWLNDRDKPAGLWM